MLQSALPASCRRALSPTGWTSEEEERWQCIFTLSMIAPESLSQLPEKASRKDVLNGVVSPGQLVAVSARARFCERYSVLDLLEPRALTPPA